MIKILKKRKITNTSKLISLMSRNLDTELGIIRFYEDNLHLFKDKKSRDIIKSLVLASLRHASMFVEEIHRLQSMEKQKKIRVPAGLAGKNAIFTLQEAMREEKGAEEIYRYEALRIAEAKTRAVLLKIASEEASHQLAVKKIAAGIAKGMPAGKGKKALKKAKLI